MNLDVNPVPVIQVDRWKLQFNGHGYPVAFLEHLEKITAPHLIPSNVLLYYMPELFKVMLFYSSVKTVSFEIQEISS